MNPIISTENFTFNKITKTFIAEESDLRGRGIGVRKNFILKSAKTGNEVPMVFDSATYRVEDGEGGSEVVDSKVNEYGELLYCTYIPEMRDYNFSVKIFND